MNELLKRRKRLTEIEVQCYLLQLISVLIHLHKSKVIHRDLKLGNLFLSDNMEIKLGDFGLAAKIDFEGEKKRTICGTPNYIAPEILEDKNGHSYEVDIWSLGVILYTFLIGKPPFETNDVKSTYRKIRMGTYTFPEHISISPYARNLIENLLINKPEKRLTLEEIRGHSFLRNAQNIPKLMPISTLACPPSATFIKQYSGNGGYQENESYNRTNRLENTTPIPISNIAGMRFGLKEKKDFNNTERVMSVDANGNNSHAIGLMGLISAQNTVEKHKNNIGGGLNNIGFNEKNVVANNEKNGFTNEKIGFTNEKNGFTNEKIGFTNEKNGFNNEKNGFNNEKNGFNNEKIGFTNEKNGFNNEKNIIAFNEKNAIVFNEKNMAFSTNEKLMSNEKNAMIIEKNNNLFTEEKLKLSEKDNKGMGSLANRIFSKKTTAVYNTNNTENSRERLTSYEVNKLRVNKKSFGGESANNLSNFLKDELPVPTIWVKKWVDYSSKYGLGYLLSNGSSGAYFNDATKILSEGNSSENVFNYIERNATTKQDIINEYSFEEYPKELQKKVVLLQHFKRYLEGDDINKIGRRNEPAQLTTNTNSKIKKNIDDKEKFGLVYIKKWMRNKHAIMFRFNNKLVQVIFQDQTEVLLSSELKVAVYVNKKQERTSFPLATAFENKNPEISKRLKYAKDILNQMVGEREDLKNKANNVINNNENEPFKKGKIQLNLNNMFFQGIEENLNMIGKNLLPGSASNKTGKNLSNG